MGSRAIVCSFASALGDLPKRLHGDDAAVLAVLEANPRFTVWEATEFTKLAKTLDRLTRAGRIEHIDKEPYPWVNVRVMPEPAVCVECKGAGSFLIVGRHRRVCTKCGGHGWVREANDG